MTPQAPYETLLVARQPVLDAALSTWGYFHFYRRCLEHTHSDFSDPLLATLSVIQCLPACAETCALPHKALIHVPEAAVLAGIPKAIGPDCLTPIISAQAQATPELLAALGALKAEGYKLALDLTAPGSGAAALLPLADLAILDFGGAGAPSLGLEEAATALAAGGATLLAKRVETDTALAQAKALGASLFSGHFFAQPKTVSQRTLSPAQATRLALLDLLSHEEPATDQLVAAIEADASVSYRVLRMLNSAHFGLIKKVSSVRQAVLLAGWVQLCAWLRVMVMADMTPSHKARELLHLSAQRAKFFELLALASDRRDQAEQLFLLGLLSLLPAMLDMPMQRIVGALALEEDLRQGLCGEPGPYARWLALAQAIEDARWDEMAQHAVALALPTGSVAEAYNSSFQWADRLLSAIPGGAHA